MITITVPQYYDRTIWISTIYCSAVIHLARFDPECSKAHE